MQAYEIIVSAEIIPGKTDVAKILELPSTSSEEGLVFVQREGLAMQFAWSGRVESPEAAVDEVLSALTALGVRVTHFHPSLVGKTEIAFRLGVPPSYVTKWSKKLALPLPYFIPSEGHPLYFWNDVVDWAHREGLVSATTRSGARRRLWPFRSLSFEELAHANHKALEVENA